MIRKVMKFLKTHLDDIVRCYCTSHMFIDEECYAFFEDICTVNELKALSQRLQVAKMLRAGDSYETIVEETGASTATISRVKRCLVYGADGYTVVLDRLAGTK